MSRRYDDMRERQREHDSERAAAAAAAAKERLDQTNKMFLEREWRIAGYEPRYNKDGSLTAPSTLKLIGSWPPPAIDVSTQEEPETTKTGDAADDEGSDFKSF